MIFVSEQTRQKAFQKVLSEVDPYAREVDICIGVLDWESPGIIHHDFTYKVKHPGIWEGARDAVRDFLLYFNDEIMEAWVSGQRIDEEAKKKGGLLRA